MRPARADLERAVRQLRLVPLCRGRYSNRSSCTSPSPFQHFLQQPARESEPREFEGTLTKPKYSSRRSPYRACVTASIKYGSPRFTTSIPRRIADASSLGSDIGPEAATPILLAMAA